MDDSQRDLEDYNMDGTTLAKGKTTHATSGAAATSQLGTWLSDGVLGDGKFGAVSRQRRAVTGTSRAVKILKLGTQSNIRREIRMMIFLKNYRRLFVDFYAWYELDFTFIVMEYVSGGDLMAYVRNVGALAEGVARGIAEQILQALFIMHEHEYMHCDIKPENILVAGTNPVRIKVADFGQTKTIEGSYNSTSGTRAWAAPEQSTPNYKEPVDMWAAGCVVYFLLTSLTPFVSDHDQSPIAIVQAHTFAAWPRVPRNKFQLHCTQRIPGDQIIVRGVSNAANDFLNNLIVREPTSRMPVYTALRHNWICNTTPLESALQRGDLPLSRLLARLDFRYQHVWADPLPGDVSEVVLRFAAANGHRDLAALVLQTIPADYSPPLLTNWPNTSHALIGAAKIGNLAIIDLLLNSDWYVRQDVSGLVLQHAAEAALLAGHNHVLLVLMPRIPLRVACGARFSGLIAGHSDRIILLAVIDRYKQYSVCLLSGVVSFGVNIGGGSPAYQHWFPTMLLSAARRGNIANLQLLLSDPPSSPLQIADQVLQTAASLGYLPIVRLLLEHFPTEIGVTTARLDAGLNNAVVTGHVDVVQYLLARGALPCSTAIGEAVWQNHKGVMRLLTRVLIHENTSPRVSTARRVSDEAIAHCDLWRLRWPETSPLNWISNIHKAAATGDLQVVQFLLQLNHPPEERNVLLSAALVGAAEAGQTRIVQYLHTAGIDIKNPEPWCRAAYNGHVAVLELLLGCGKPPATVLAEAVRLAVKAGHIGVVILLLDHGAVWNGPAEPVLIGVLAAFARGRALPQIGAPASRR
ncbi:Protein kinase protein rad53 [Maublancomyces gigas]|uniref:Protein kinase protein rad53 n=1 Tax=Discina gigas TaxID=1032678 RepID=A0ABR3GSV3_9PEZI